MVQYDDAMKALIHDALVRGDSPQEILAQLPIGQTSVYGYRYNIMSFGTSTPHCLSIRGRLGSSPQLRAMPCMSSSRTARCLLGRDHHSLRLTPGWTAVVLERVGWKVHVIVLALWFAS